MAAMWEDDITTKISKVSITSKDWNDSDYDDSEDETDIVLDTKRLIEEQTIANKQLEQKLDKGIKDPKYKTEMCNLMKDGKCTKFGCTYAHSKEELRRRDIPKHVKRPELYKTQKCRDLPNCPRGDKCGFYHSEEDKVNYPCRFGSRCKKVGCEFTHPKINLDTPTLTPKSTMDNLAIPKQISPKEQLPPTDMDFPILESKKPRPTIQAKPIWYIGQTPIKEKTVVEITIPTPTKKGVYTIKDMETEPVPEKITKVEKVEPPIDKVEPPKPKVVEPADVMVASDENTIYMRVPKSRLSELSSLVTELYHKGIENIHLSVY